MRAHLLPLFESAQARLDAYAAAILKEWHDSKNSHWWEDYADEATDHIQQWRGWYAEAIADNLVTDDSHRELVYWLNQAEAEIAHKLEKEMAS